MDLDREIYIKDGMKIICQFESLYRLKFSSIDLIILDEFESMLN